MAIDAGATSPEDEETRALGAYHERPSYEIIELRAVGLTHEQIRIMICVDGCCSHQSGVTRRCRVQIGVQIITSMQRSGASQRQPLEGGAPPKPARASKRPAPASSIVTTLPLPSRHSLPRLPGGLEN